MVGSSSAVSCDSCEGVVLTAAKKFKCNKLTLRKSQQKTVKLCACTQPSGSSSSSNKVCHASPKASAVKILDNVLINPARPARPIYEDVSDDEADFRPASRVSQGSSKILRNLLTKTPKKKANNKFKFDKYVQQIAKNPGTSKQTEEVRIEVGNKAETSMPDISMFNSDIVMDATSTQKFAQLMTENSKSKISNSQSQGPSHATKNSELDVYEAFGGDAAQEFEEILCKEIDAMEAKVAPPSEEADVEIMCRELGIDVTPGPSTSRGSQLNTPSISTPTANTVRGVVTGAPSDSRQASPLSNDAPAAPLAPSSPVASERGSINAAADEIPNTPVPSIAPAASGKGEAAADEQMDTSTSTMSSVEDDDYTALSTQHVDEVNRRVEATKARLAEVDKLEKEEATLYKSMRNINAHLSQMNDKISSMEAQSAPGRIRLNNELLLLERSLLGLLQRKITLREEMNAKGELIWQFKNKHF